LMELVVSLPSEVKGMAQLTVEIAETLIEVGLEGAAWLRVDVPRPIDGDAARAKFVKKHRELRITAPLQA